DGLKQPGSNLVGICVKKAYPSKIVDLRKALKKQRQSILQTQIFAIAGRVLANKRNLAYPSAGEILSLRNHRFKMAGTELAAKLRDNAEAAGMVAALGDLYIRRPFPRRKEARRPFAIEVGR